MTVVIPTLGRPSLKEAIASCGKTPTEVEVDDERRGAGPTRNIAISRVKTTWVGFLDDDDRVTRDYGSRVESEIKANPDADAIVFRAKYSDGRVLPKVPQVIYGNVPISFCVKTELAKKYPFVKGENAFMMNEDYLFLKTLEENGAKIVFSPHVTYLVRPKNV